MTLRRALQTHPKPSCHTLAANSHRPHFEVAAQRTGSHLWGARQRHRGHPSARAPRSTGRAPSKKSPASTRCRSLCSSPGRDQAPGLRLHHWSAQLGRQPGRGWNRPCLAGALRGARRTDSISARASQVPCSLSCFALHAPERGRAPLWHQPSGAGRSEKAALQRSHVLEAAACQAGQRSAVSAYGGLPAGDVGLGGGQQLRAVETAGRPGQGGRP